MTAPASVEVHLYAAARAAAGGRDSMHLDVPDLATLREALVQAHGPRMARVLASCSFLLDGVAVGPSTDAALAGVTAVDVLPPFAGG
jgi:molybdopterin converting factor small subunit